TPSGGPYCYVYDGNGLRVAKISGGTGSNCSGGTYTKLYWRSLSGDAITETDGTGSVTTNYTEYVFFAGRRVASRVTGSNGGYTALFYYFADQLGSTRTMTTGSGKNNDGSNQTPGQLCYDADFTPYGLEMQHTERLQTTACPPNYKFTGYEHDSETGLDYAFGRYYSSRLVRFYSTDPLGGSVGSLQSQNAYAYVLNDPSNLVDPTGQNNCAPAQKNCQVGGSGTLGGIELGAGFSVGICGLGGDCATLSDSQFAGYLPASPDVSFGNGYIWAGTTVIGTYQIIWSVNLFSSGSTSWAWNFTKTFLVNLVSPTFYKTTVKNVAT